MLTIYTLTWTATTDNIGVIGYNIYQNGTLKTTTTTTSLAVTGLAAATNYNLYVTAKDAAGNISTASNTISPTTLSTRILYCNSNGGQTKNTSIVFKLALSTIIPEITTDTETIRCNQQT